MLKINRKEKSFALLEKPSLAAAAITERYDLQEFISNSPDDFFQELGLQLFLIGKELTPSEAVKDRIDLLALDKEGHCVVVELKRGRNKLQMFQAVSYAAMIAQWSPSEILDLVDENRKDALESFLDVDIDEINRDQQIVLVAEDFDYALLIGAEWLSEKHGIDIRCCRISMAKDEDDGSEFLVCSNIYPAPELVEQAVSRGRRKTGRVEGKWVDWDSAINAIDSPVVAKFFRSQLDDHRESYLHHRLLYWRIDGKRRWSTKARKKLAYVWQKGRFEGDVEFWKNGISDPSTVKPVKQGKSLRLFLITKKDFDFFSKSAGQTLLDADWQEVINEDVFQDLEDDA